MPRPRRCRRIRFEPDVTYFKPAGVRMVDLSESILTLGEFEAIRLKDLLGMDQEKAAKQMSISQPTFHRLLLTARKKIADAIVHGKAIKIEGGKYKLKSHSAYRVFKCQDCGHEWNVPFGIKRPLICPECRSKNIYRIK